MLNIHIGYCFEIVRDYPISHLITKKDFGPGRETMEGVLVTYEVFHSIKDDGSL